MRPAKPTCMLLRAELALVLGEVAALVAVAVRLVDATEEAWLVVAGAVAVLMAEATDEEKDATTELVASATLEETETATEEAEETTEEDAEDTEAEPV